MPDGSRQSRHNSIRISIDDREANQRSQTVFFSTAGVRQLQSAIKKSTI